MTACTCAERLPHHADLDEISLGCDPTDGRYADVSVKTCRACGQRWLHYFVEYEGFSGSARWACCQIDAETAATVTPETAATVIDGAPWHWRGGSYWNSTGRRGTGPLHWSL